VRDWSLESGDRFCVDVFHRNLALVTMKHFSRSVYFLKKFYKILYYL
jgi:hypothetical protein